MGRSRIISADSHVFELPNLYVDNCEAKFKDRAPSVIRIEGADWWVCDGHKMLSLAGGVQVGMRFEDPEKLTFTGTYENVQPGGYLPDEHVKDMDADGVDAGVVFPSIGFLMYNIVQDSQLLTAIFRTYNDWLGEFCTPFPNRIKGIALLNVDNVQEGISELERCHKLGLVGALIPVYPPVGKRYGSLEYEPLWAAAQDLGISINLHVATNRPGTGQELSDIDTLTASFRANLDYWVRMSLGDIIFNGVFERYPKLRVGAVEHELSWVPYFLERIDYAYTQEAPREGWYRFKEAMLPSDYFHRNVFVGFQQDGLGVKLRNIIGVDNLQWGSDYPHQEGTFPKSREILEEILAGCTEEEKAKITCHNAERIYGL